MTGVPLDLPRSILGPQNSIPLAPFKTATSAAHEAGSLELASPHWAIMVLVWLYIEGMEGNEWTATTRPY